MQVVSADHVPSAAAAGAKVAILLEPGDELLNVGLVKIFAIEFGAITVDEDGYETVWVAFKEDPRTIMAVHPAALDPLLANHYPAFPHYATHTVH